MLLRQFFYRHKQSIIQKLHLKKQSIATHVEQWSAMRESIGSIAIALDKKRHIH